MYERSISISLDVLAFEADLDDGFDDDSSPLRGILRGYFSLLISIIFNNCITCIQTQRKTEMNYFFIKIRQIFRLFLLSKSNVSN